MEVRNTLWLGVGVIASERGKEVQYSAGATPLQHTGMASHRQVCATLFDYKYATHRINEPSPVRLPQALVASEPSLIKALHRHSRKRQALYRLLSRIHLNRIARRISPCTAPIPKDTNDKRTCYVLCLQNYC